MLARKWSFFPLFYWKQDPKFLLTEKEITRQDVIFSFFSDNSVIQGITAMSGCLSWEEKGREVGEKE